MTYMNFAIAFWHPFGPHGRETPGHIIDRKRLEIEANGWTLWSFQRRSDSMLDAWQRELAKAGQVFAFCSGSRNAVDPARDGSANRPLDCSSYRFIGMDWQPMPTGIRVPHPFRPGQTCASAFVVEQIFYPVEPFDPPALEWFSLTEGPWRQMKLPTRGEYVIRPGGTLPMPKVSAVLQLKRPYLAVVTSESGNP